MFNSDCFNYNHFIWYGVVFHWRFNLCFLNNKIARTFPCTFIYIHLWGVSSNAFPTFYWFAFLLLLSYNCSLYILYKIFVRYRFKKYFLPFFFLNIHFLNECEWEKVISWSIMASQPPSLAYCSSRIVFIIPDNSCRTHLVSSLIACLKTPGTVWLV